jgi:hypothetical protein
MEARELELESTESIYEALWHSTGAYLNLIVGLKIDSSTIVDIAAFGDSALPAH